MVKVGLSDDFLSKLALAMMFYRVGSTWGKEKALFVTGEENIQPGGIVNVTSSVLLSSPSSVCGAMTESE